MTGRHIQHPSEFDQIPHGRWHSTGKRVQAPIADQYEVDRHAEKQGVSYADAWRYFERDGYDMSDVLPQYHYVID